MDRHEDDRQHGDSLPAGSEQVEPASGHVAAPWEKAQNSSLLLDLFLTVVRRRKVILLFALAGALGGSLLNFGRQPLFRARTLLDIESLNSGSMEREAVAPTGEASRGTNDTYVQAQITMLQSQTLLKHTMRNLEAQPHSAFMDRDDLVSRVRRALHVGPPPIAYDVLMDNAAKRIKVKPIGLTGRVEITCESWNAELSARICNTLPKTFRNDEFANRGAEATTTGAWLTRQAEDARVQMEESEKKLQEATGGEGAVPSQENTSVSEGRLRQLQEEVVKAEADRIEKQAALEVSLTASPDSLTGVIHSPELRQSQQQLAELRNEAAELIPPRTEDNPKVIRLRSQMKEVEAQIEQQRATAVGRIKSEYAAARHREDLLRITYEIQERNTSDEMGKTIKVNLLRHEVDSEQQLSQTLLQRAKEAGFASGMRINPIRVVDAAKAPRAPFSPRPGSALGVGLLLGSLCGVGFAFYKEGTPGVIHLPGEIQRRLHVQELGLIPNMDHRSTLKARAFKRGLLGTRSSPVIKVGPAAPPRREIAVDLWRDQFSIAAEAYRSTTFSILLATRKGGPAKTYVVSSSNSGEGRTTVVSNLGVALSQSQRRVVMVDGDLRKPGLHKALGLENRTGLRNVLRGELDPATTALATFCQPTGIANLSLISAGSGTEEVTELLHSPRASDLFNRLSMEFDLVLIDTPPMLHMEDARIFATHAAGVILVFRAGVNDLEQAHAAHDIFVRDRVRVLGSILNDFNPSREDKGGYYDSYDRDQQADADREEDKARV